MDYITVLLLLLCSGRFWLSWVSARIICCVNHITRCRIVSLGSVMCLLTFRFYDSASSLSFVFSVVLLRIKVYAIITCYVSLIAY